ncbi:MAG: hypothetical protein WA941_14800 [Nitrososphaeraceae archaeon]
MTYLTPTHIKKYSLLGSRLSELELKKLSVSVGVGYVTPSKVDKLSHSIECKGGVDYILTHLHEPLFPRDIMTKKLGHKIEVFDMKSMLWHFEVSDYQDCRISAYPRLTQYKGINLVAPTFIMIDLDLSDLGTEIALEKALKTTLMRIHQTFKTMPTVLWTGNGYHIYLPIKAFVLEEEEVFAKFQHQGNSNEPSLSTKFMRYAEAYFTNKKHDPQHRPSVNSCLLRVPGTYNSKNGQKVKVTQQWDGKRPAIQYVLRDFRKYLIQKRLDEINEQNIKSKTIPEVKLIRWIEQVLQTPISDYRRYCVWRILTPYLVNVRRLPDEESYSVISWWLEKCNLIKRLSFDPKYISKQNVRNARRIGYYPISWNNLKLENIYLYNLLIVGNTQPVKGG